ncbi:plasmid partitioning protein RepB C-terminal domain-containing protein [Paraburkholderia sp. C35]|uniref:ParB/RepB/Spo0J family partition protein n=1 Tax=Paraburkholderia sp. C35 TaxID=2126993 RepID=UPI000D698BDA|nr:plasmid partitioning protein RepB C-terminal domain-containing protein [Paraburkholderia sp. C35]
MNAPGQVEPVEVPPAFVRELVELPVDALRPHRPLVGVATHGKKFLQVLASIATVGLVEPLVVTREGNVENGYVVLDGCLRLEALHRLGKRMATCMFATDNETYTYNRHVNRLTAGQDARMIALAVKRGVPQDRIAAVLGVNERTVKRRVRLLEGVCPDAAALLADKNCPAATFEVLKTMRPLRQLEAAELMCDQSNFTSAFARAIRLATPAEQLLPAAAPYKTTSGEATDQIERLEREIAALQSKMTDVEERYGVEHLQLAVSISYVIVLLQNERVRVWLEKREPLAYGNLCDLVATEGPTLAKEAGQSPVVSMHRRLRRSRLAHAN